MSVNLTGNPSSNDVYSELEASFAVCDFYSPDRRARSESATAAAAVVSAIGQERLSAQERPRMKVIVHKGARDTTPPPDTPPVFSLFTPTKLQSFIGEEAKNRRLHMEGSGWTLTLTPESGTLDSMVKMHLTYRLQFLYLFAEAIYGRAYFLGTHPTPVAGDIPCCVIERPKTNMIMQAG